jgi:prevent-host-death family protein
MKQVSITEAKANFYALAEEAAAGEEIIITKYGKPKARLRPLEPTAPQSPAAQQP